MAARVDPRLIQAAREHREQVYLTDRACTGCGYNLRGLVVGTACPECGQIARVPKDLDAPLSCMPLPVIRRFGWASVVAVIGCIGVVVSYATPFLPVPYWASEAVLLAAMTCWIGATFWLTPALDSQQAQHYGFTDKNPLRHLARWLQFGWPAAILISMFVPIVPGFVIVLIGAVGLVGTICACLILQELAAWARDDSARMGLNHAMWGLPLGLLAIGFVGVSRVGPLVSAGAGLLAVYGVAALAYGVVSLSRSLVYSIDHAKNAVWVDQRRKERQERWENHRGRMIDRADAAREERGTRL